MITGRMAAVLATVLAASCVNSPSADDEAPGGPVASSHEPGRASAAVPVASTDEILGEWDIVSFEGYRPALRMNGSTRAAFADFGPDGVGLRIECNWSGASGEVRNGRFVPNDTGPRAQTAMGCGEERESRDARLFGFFDLSPRVERLADGRLRVAAGERELILQRPAERRLGFLPSAGELKGRWKLEELTRYHPEGGVSGTGLSELPGRLVIGDDRLGYDRCPQYDLTYRYTANGRLEKVAGPDLPPSAVGCADLAGQSGMRDFPSNWKAMEVLHASPSVEKSGDGRLHVRAGEYALGLSRD